MSQLADSELGGDGPGPEELSQLEALWPYPHRWWYFCKITSRAGASTLQTPFGLAYERTPEVPSEPSHLVENT